ncbi:MAG: RNA polymerase sigma factor [Pseudomonadota bacterium]
MRITELKHVFSQFGTEIEQFLTHRTGCPETAADLKQELFLRVLKSSLEQKPAIKNMRAYLYRAAANIAVDHQRSLKRRSVISVPVEDNVAEPLEFRTPERHTISKQRLTALNHALTELSPLAQECFYLARIEGMKQADIARKLNVHVTTVEKNISRAVKHLFISVQQSDK